MSDIQVKPTLPTVSISSDAALSRAGGAVTSVSSETELRDGGPWVPVEEMSSADQMTVLGNGTTYNELHGAGGADGILVQNQDAPLGSFTTLNFDGDGVTASDTGGGTARISIPGVGPSITIQNLLFAPAITPAALPAGDTDNYAPTLWASTTRVRQATNIEGSTLTGLSALPNGTVRIFENLGPGPLIFAGEDSGSSAGNEIISMGGDDLTIYAGGAAWAIYDGAATRWRADSMSKPDDNYIDIRSFGARGDGITDNRIAIQAAIDMAVAKGKMVFVPAGTFLVGRAPFTTHSLEITGDGLTIFGIRGQSWLKQIDHVATGTTSCVLFFCDDKEKIVIDSLGLDGNWGNAVTKLAGSMDAIALPVGTIDVLDTTNYPASGTFGIILSAGGLPQAITYTSKTATSFLGCTGGAGTLHVNNVVGYVATNVGINQDTQVDAHNHAIMLRGCNNVRITNCDFRNVYGDFIWGGFSQSDVTQDWTRDVVVENCTGDISARNGISFGQAGEGWTISTNQFYNIYQEAIDLEPLTLDQPVRDTVIENNYLGGWWSPSSEARTANCPLRIGSDGVGNNQSGACRKIRVIGNTIQGCIIASFLIDCTISDNRIVPQSGANSFSPIYIYQTADDVLIDNNYVYDNSNDPGAEAHPSAIAVQAYRAGSITSQPAGVKITRNKVHARNAHAGILVRATGGFAVGQVAQPAVAGTATGVAGLTLTDATAAWTIDQFIYYQVVINGVVGVILSNTATTLTLVAPIASTSPPPNGTVGWRTPLGEYADTPAVGDYQIVSVAGLVEVVDNAIDCGYDGNAAGTFGIVATSEVEGMRVSIRENTIKNATDHAIRILYQSPQVAYFVEVVENKALDTQPIKTCVSVVNFVNGTDGVRVGGLIVRGGSAMGGIPKIITGLQSDYWLQQDGLIQEWVGYDSPNGVIAAPIASTFYCRNGGANTTFWVKEDGGPPIDADLGTGSTTVSVVTGATRALPAVTTTVDNCLIYTAICSQPGAGTATWDTWTFANLALTGIVQITSIGAIAAAYGVLPAAGATGAGTVTNNSVSGSPTQFGPCNVTYALTPQVPEVAPTFVANGLQSSGLGGPISPAWPIGVVLEDDYAICAVETLEGDVVTLSVANGFELLPSSPQTGTFGGGGSEINFYGCRAYKSNMAAPTFTHTGAHILGIISVFRGAANGADIGWAAK